MKFFTDKIEWTDAMKAFTKEQLENKLSSFNLDIDDATVKFSKLNDRFVKVTISIGEYRSQTIESDFYAAVKATAAKIKTLIKKSLNKIAVRHDITEDPTQEFTMSSITREKLLFIESISSDEAIARFEKTDYGFFLYKDIDENDVVSVLYHRPDKTYGVIRCR